MTFVADPASPWYGMLFVAALRGKHIHRYQIDDNMVVDDEMFYINRDGFTDEEGRMVLGVDRRMRDVEFYNGSLYVIGDSFGMVKMTPMVDEEETGVREGDIRDGSSVGEP